MVSKSFHVNVKIQVIKLKRHKRDILFSALSNGHFQKPLTVVHAHKNEFDSINEHVGRVSKANTSTDT